MQIVELIRKFMDNINLGKFVTDVIPGMLLTMALVLVVGKIGDLSIFPADQADEIDAKHTGIETRIAHETDIIRTLLQEAGRDAPLSVKKLDDSLELYSRLLHDVEVFNVHAEALKVQIETLSKLPANELKPRRPELESLIKEREDLLLKANQFKAHKTIMDTLEVRKLRYENKIAEQRTLSNNVEVFNKSFSALLIFGIALGLMLSQINRLLFIDLFFNWVYSRRRGGRKKRDDTARAAAFASILSDDIAKEMYDRIISQSYRYVEGSLNMALPLVAIIVALTFYFKESVPLDPMVMVGLSLVIAVLLYLMAYRNYMSFRTKEQELISLIRVRTQTTSSP